MSVRLTAANGQKLRDTRNGREYSEIVVDEKLVKYFVIVDSDQDPEIHVMEQKSDFDTRIRDLEDAAVELADILSSHDATLAVHDETLDEHGDEIAAHDAALGEHEDAIVELAELITTVEGEIPVEEPEEEPEEEESEEEPEEEEQDG